MLTEKLANDIAEVAAQKLTNVKTAAMGSRGKALMGLAGAAGLGAGAYGLMGGGQEGHPVDYEGLNPQLGQMGGAPDYGDAMAPLLDEVRRTQDAQQLNMGPDPVNLYTRNANLDELAGSMGAAASGMRNTFGPALANGVGGAASSLANNYATDLPSDLVQAYLRNQFSAGRM